MVARDDREAIKRALSELRDDRTWLVLEPLRWVLEAIDKHSKPYQVIVLEQVPQVLPVWEAYEEALKELGYSVACGVLRAEQYGVPQTRKRAILIARFGREKSVALPDPSHRLYKKGFSPDTGELGLEPWVSMGEVLDRDEDFFVISNYGSGGNPKARGRRGSREPSATVTGKIFRNRIVSKNDVLLPRLTASEAGRLQSFPKDYPWSGRDIGQQIGNAVPPRLAMHVLCAAFGWGKPDEGSLSALDHWAAEKDSD
ncbi:DNA cytosine methyltransferase [Actinomadura adrarensis]|uniref:DNA (cytosine-5-)-methyltransferase n=1 Tax=Actinomadura adrarensis TaxID=1819600 RepID=A0ABW3CAC3_9ACTN